MSEYEPARHQDEIAATQAADPAGNWFAGMARLWLLRPGRKAPLGSPIFASLAMGAAWLILWISIDRWEVQPNPLFFVEGIPLLAWYALAIVGLAAVLRRLCGTPEAAFAPMLALTMGAVPAPLLLYTIAAEYLNPAGFLAATLAVCAYTFVYLARALHGITGESKRTAAFAGLLFIAGFIWITDRLNVIPDLWTPAETQANTSDDATDDAEAILFAQPSLIDQALAAVQGDAGSKSNAASGAGAGAGAKPHAFFLGFAGVGDQKVFAQEIGLAARVLGERYGIDDRTVSLINDERDLEGAPLATVSGLKYALRGLGSRMNLDRDVLFLAISSHGTEDPAIAVSNAQLPLNDLTEQDLADALRESGIKWRVIVISACYAGAFIDSLRNPQTIVITAAAADRTSFGCSNDSDLTYFGEAFYRDALPDAPSLKDAFSAAKTAIASREREEQVTASDPQAYFGEEMQKKLAAFEAR